MKFLSHTFDIGARKYPHSSIAATVLTTLAVALVAARCGLSGISILISLHAMFMLLLYDAL